LPALPRGGGLDKRGLPATPGLESKLLWSVAIDG
jgi:hypothetical protein